MTIFLRGSLLFLLATVGSAQAQRVGIGTTAPATTLDVRTADNSARLTIGSTANEGGGISFGNANHGLQRGYPTLGSNNNVGFYTSAGSLYLSANGTSTSQFVLTTAGNVGIGLSSPGTRLSVKGSGAALPNTTGTTQSAGHFARFSDNTNLVLDLGGNGASGSWLQSADASGLNFSYPLLLNPNGGSVAVGTTATTAHFEVSGGEVRLPGGGSGHTHFNFPDGRNYLRGSTIIADLGGQVGIGTSSPASLLDVRSADASARLTIGSASNEGGGISFGNSGHGLQRGYPTQGANNHVGFYTTAGNLYLSTNSTATDNFVLTADGNVGVGTASPGQKLDVVGSASFSGSAFVGVRLGVGTSAPASTVDIRTADNSARLTIGNTANEGGGISLGNAGHGLQRGYPVLGADNNVGLYTTAGNLYLSANGTATDKFVLTPNGRVGIGTSNPIAPLHIMGGVGCSAVANSQYRRFAANVGLDDYTVGPSGAQIANVAAYIGGGNLWVNGMVVAGQLNVSSDQRIKHVLGRSDRASDLVALNKIRITDYRYIDQVNNTSQVVKKVIAQEVQQVLPAATSQSRQAIPNVYQSASRVSYANGQVTLTTAKPHELPASGGQLRLYTSTNEELNVTATVVDAHTVRFASATAYPDGLFVYGKFVDDFLSVDYDAIAMLNVSATQELARKVEALEKQNAVLQSQAAQAAADHASLLDLQAQVARLLGSDGQARR